MKKLLFFFAILSIGTTLKAQQSGSLDISFNPQDSIAFSGDNSTGFDYRNYVQSDGKIIVVGAFNSYFGYFSRGIVRLFADGTIDSSFVSPYNNLDSTYKINLHSAALRADGKIAVGLWYSRDFNPNLTSFTSYYDLDLLNTNGTIDNSFACDTFIQTGPTITLTGVTINELKFQPDGKLLVSGGYGIINGVPNTKTFFRLNANGTHDTSFLFPGLTIGTINKILLQPDGKILIGGNYTMTVNGVTHKKINRLNTNGTIDTTFNTGTGVAGGSTIYVYDIVLQNDGKIIIGGSFISVGGFSSNYIARLNTNGSFDTTYPSQNLLTGVSSAPYVSTILKQPDGKIVITGIDIRKSARYNTIRLNIDGTIDTSFFCTAFNFLRNLELLNDGRIIGPGRMGNYGVPGTNYSVLAQSLPRGIKALLPNGQLDESFPRTTAFDMPPTKVICDANDKIYVSGPFGRYKNSYHGFLTRLNSNGDIDTSYHYIGIGKTTAKLNAMDLTTSHKLMIAGTITWCNNVNYTAGVNSALLKYDGTSDPSYTISNIGSGFSYLQSILCLPNGKIIGGIYQQNETQGCGIGLTDTLGANLTLNPAPIVPFNSYSSVFDIAAQPGGNYVFVGKFNYTNPATVNVARITPSFGIDYTFNFTDFPNDTVFAVATQSDGKIILGGVFTTMGTTSLNKLARLNADGTLDPSFTIGLGPNAKVSDIVVQPDDKIIIAGNFTAYDNQPSGGIARLMPDGAIDTSFHVGTGFTRVHVWTSNPTSPAINSITLDNNGQILVVGDFVRYNNTVRNKIARLNNSILLTGNPGNPLLRASSAMCGGGVIEVPYTAVGVFNTNNVFTIQLSDVFGSFANPLTIGTLASYTSDTIVGTIPPNISAGSGYKARVVASSPYIVGKENSVPVAIQAAPAQPLPLNIYTLNVCQGESNVLYGLPGIDSLDYEWTYGGANVTLTDNGDSAIVDFSPTATSGTLSVSVTDGCGFSVPQTVSITVNALPTLNNFIASQDTAYFGQNNISYAIPVDPSATYTWSYTGNDVTINPTNATLSFGPNATSGTLSIIATNNCGSDTLAMYITVLEPVGINTLNATNIQLYNYGNTLVVNTPNNVTMAVFNAVGQQILPAQNVLKGRTEIALPSVTSGIYLVRLTDGKTTVTRKIIISN